MHETGSLTHLCRMQFYFPYLSFGRIHFEFKCCWMMNLNFIQISKVHFVSNLNSAKPDQTPHSAATDLVFHCLPMSHKKDARLKLVNRGPGWGIMISE